MVEADTWVKNFTIEQFKPVVRIRLTKWRLRQRSLQSA